MFLGSPTNIQRIGQMSEIDIFWTSTGLTCVMWEEHDLCHIPVLPCLNDHLSRCPALPCGMVSVPSVDSLGSSVVCDPFWRNQNRRCFRPVSTSPASAARFSGSLSWCGQIFYIPYIWDFYLVPTGLLGRPLEPWSLVRLILVSTLLLRLFLFLRYDRPHKFLQLFLQLIQSGNICLPNISIAYSWCGFSTDFLGNV